MDKYDPSIKPVIGKVKLENVPKELRKINQWTCWKYDWDGNKWTKPPVSIFGFKHDHTKSNYTFEEVFEAHKDDPTLGIGFSLRKSDPFCGIDFDNVLDDNHKLLPEYSDLLADLPDTYAEVSPSGKGIRVFGKGDIKNFGHTKGVPFEFYSSGRYLTITGDANGASGNPLLDLKSYINKLKKPKSAIGTQAPNAVYEGSTNLAIIKDYLSILPNDDYDDWLKVGMILHHESGGHPKALEDWDEWSKGSSKYVPDGCALKWQSFGKSKEPPVTMGTLLEMAAPYRGMLLKKSLHSQVLSAFELLKTKSKPREFAIEPLFLSSSFNMIHAPRGLGKTNFALSLAISMSQGVPFLKWKIQKPLRVLYVDGELSLKALHSRVELNVSATGVKFTRDNLGLITPEKLPDQMVPNLSRGENQAWLNAHIDSYKANVLIIDSLFTCFHGQTESQEAWEIVQVWMSQLRARGLCVILIHHDNKSGKQQSGFANKETIMDEVLHLTQTKEHALEDGMMMHCEFSKNRNLYGLEIAEFECGFEKTPGTLNKVHWSWTAENKSLTSTVLELMNLGLTTREIAIELDENQSKIARMRKKFLADGTVSEDKLKFARRNRK